MAGCDKSRAKVRELIKADERVQIQQTNCNCKLCVTCMQDWIKCMQEQIDDRQRKADSDYFGTFGLPILTKEQVKEEFRWFTTPQVVSARDQMFYNDYVAKLWRSLDMLEIDRVTVQPPPPPPMTLDVTQLELMNVLDEYIRVENGGRDYLLQRLSDVATEMQQYGDGGEEAKKDVHKRVVEKCQAFMMQYKDTQRYSRNVLKSSQNTPTHKGFQKLLDRVQRLKYETEWAELRDQWNADPSQPDDGEDDFVEHEIYSCGPYCTCSVCQAEKGYRTVQLKNRNKTITKTIDIPVLQDADEVYKRNLESSYESSYDSFEEDWFHYSEIEDSSTTTSTATSDIEVNVPYHKVMNPLYKQQKQTRRFNRDSTAAVEQRLQAPKVSQEHPRRCSLTVYSEYDDNVVRGRQPPKFEKRLRKRPLQGPLVFTHWRTTGRAVVDPDEVTDASEIDTDKISESTTY